MRRTDWEFVVVGNLLTRAEVSFGINDNLRLVRNLNDLSIAIRLAAVVNEACQVPLCRRPPAERTHDRSVIWNDRKRLCCGSYVTFLVASIT